MTPQRESVAPHPGDADAMGIGGTGAAGAGQGLLALPATSGPVLADGAQRPAGGTAPALGTATATTAPQPVAAALPRPATGPGPDARPRGATPASGPGILTAWPDPDADPGTDPAGLARRPMAGGPAPCPPAPPHGGGDGHPAMLVRLGERQARKGTSANRPRPSSPGDAIAPPRPAPASAAAPPVVPSVAPRVTPRATPPGGRTLAQTLLERGAVDPGALMQAMELESRSAARLGDILLREGMIASEALLQAQAALWGVRPIDPLAHPPDARLIDALGAGRCARLGVLPWRRTGGAIVVATARPEGFAALRPDLEARLGPVAMALAPEDTLHAALRAARGGQLQTLAETRSPEGTSCRGDLLGRLRLWVLAGLGVLGIGAVLAPKAVLAGLAAWAVTLMVLFTALKLAASVAVLRAGPGGGRDAGFGRARVPHGQPVAPLRMAPAQAAPGACAGDGWTAPRPTIARLPVVSILVALHGERAIAPRLVRRLGRLSWPRGLLDVILVVEEDDLPTRRALGEAGLPPWMRVLAVPPGGLRTKPRALNYALDHCRGSVIGVLDAEDAPDPDQIHQVVRRFHARGAEVACLQGVLGYYNAAENWLSRCFAVEYATWFRLMLPGLDRLGLVVPLGGTTVYFRREALERVGAWDAHNVTEDADLGLRLAREGYRTELIPAETGEEATCRPLAWIRQRSRWIKGFAITYASHMRNPRALWRDLGAWRFWGVQVLFLATLTQALLAPVLWSFWALLLGLGHPLEGALGVAGLVVLTGLFLGAEAVNIALGVVAVSQRQGLRWLRPWVPTLHLYHPMATLAGLKALWEVVAQPLYWDKTAHGRFDGAAPPPLIFAGARPTVPRMLRPQDTAATAHAAGPGGPPPLRPASPARPLPGATRPFPGAGPLPGPRAASAGRRTPAPLPPRQGQGLPLVQPAATPVTAEAPQGPDPCAARPSAAPIPPLASRPPAGHGVRAPTRTPPPRKEPAMATRQQRTEERIAHLERTAEELSDEIARQSRQLATIQRQLARLVAREAEREAEAGTQVPLADQRPPHW